MSKRMTYGEQLKHPNWQRRRLEILGRANFMCLDCGEADKTLHVHHNHYIRGLMVWEYPDDALMALCEDCHLERSALEGQLLMTLKPLSNSGIHELIGELAWWGERTVSMDDLISDILFAFDQKARRTGLLAPGEKQGCQTAG